MAIPTVPEIFPSAARRGSTRVSNDRPRQSVSYRTSSPCRALRCAASGVKPGSRVFSTSYSVIPTCSFALVPMRWRPAPCENVTLSCASVDQRLTGTDSNMKLRRRSVSSPLWRTGGVFSAGRDLNLPSRRLRKVPNGFSGWVTMEGEVNLPLILSPIPRGRNDFRAGQGLRARVVSVPLVRYETLQMVPPVSSVLQIEPSGAFARPPGGTGRLNFPWWRKGDSRRARCPFLRPHQSAVEGPPFHLRWCRGARGFRRYWIVRSRPARRGTRA